VKCREFVEFVMEYLEGTLGDGERLRVRGHIERVPPCVNYLASYRETVRLGNSVCAPDDELPPTCPKSS
jgi:anti-sigma factor RsiW